MATNMEANNPIQFIDFGSTYDRSGSNVKGNEALVYGRGTRGGKSKGTYQIRMPHTLDDAFKSGFTRLRIAVNNLTNETFAVLDRTDGLLIKEWEGVYRMSNANAVRWLEARLGLPEKGGGIIVFSENLSRNGGYTYRIEAKK